MTYLDTDEEEKEPSTKLLLAGILLSPLIVSAFSLPIFTGLLSVYSLVLGYFAVILVGIPLAFLVRKHLSFTIANCMAVGGLSGLVTWLVILACGFFFNLYLSYGLLLAGYLLGGTLSGAVAFVITSNLKG